MRIPPILFLIAFLLCQQLHAQQSVIDSLTRTLSEKLPDTTRAVNMMNIAIQYETIDTAKSSKAYREALGFAVGKELFYHAAIISQNYSFLFSAANQFNEARQQLMNAIHFLRKSQHPKAESILAKVYVTVAAAEQRQNKQKEAVEWQLKGISIFEKQKDYSGLVRGYANLASYFKDLNEFEKVESYAKKALQYARLTKKRSDFFTSYFYISYALTLQTKYKESEVFLDSADMYYENNINSNVLSSYHLVAGYLFMNLQKPGKAYDHFKKCYEIATQLKHRFTITQARLQMSKALSLQKKFDEAEKILFEEYDDIRKQQDVVQENTLLQYLAELYEDKGNLKLAMRYYKEHKGLADSLSREDNKRFIADLEVKYETEKKEKDIAQLQAEKNQQQLIIKQKNTINLVLVITAASLALIAFLLYRNHRNKQKLQQQKIAELETINKLAATEAVLKGEELERNRLAKDLHDGLGSMLSGIRYSLSNIKANHNLPAETTPPLDRSIEMLDSSIHEMRRVAHNMMPETLMKYGLDTALKDFCKSINGSGALHLDYISRGWTDKDIEQSASLIVYRIIQELVNNSIKHAAAHNAIVQVVLSDKNLTITVEDDGKGFDQEAISQSPGIGWSNIRNRVQLLKGNIDIQSGEGKGTSVLIEFNI